jgi:SAM-dependent methyltransferase
LRPRWPDGQCRHVADHPDALSPVALARVRRSRRHPRITEVDYLHLRLLVQGLRAALARVEGPIDDLLDVWCGSRPYDDLFPHGARCIGFDVVGNPYGVADVVSNTLLPFPDASFDLLTCIQSFQYMPDPAHTVAEFARVLRPGGTALVTVVFTFEYDRRLPFEGRYTEQQLRELFSGWADVDVQEDGGRGVAWAEMTNALASALEQRTARVRPLRLLHPLFAAGYAAVNVLGLGLARAEARSSGSAALPMNLTLTARAPSSG